MYVNVGAVFVGGLYDGRPVALKVHDVTVFRGLYGPQWGVLLLGVGGF